jgi:hypothetical protein
LPIMGYWVSPSVRARKRQQQRSISQFNFFFGSMHATLGLSKATPLPVSWDSF